MCPRLIPAQLRLLNIRCAAALCLEGSSAPSTEAVHEDFKHMTVARMPQVVAECRDHQTKHIPFGKVEFWLSKSEALDKLVSKIRSTDGVKETIVSGARIYILAHCELLNVPHALEQACIHNSLRYLGQHHEAMHWVRHHERFAQARLRFRPCAVQNCLEFLLCIQFRMFPWIATRTPVCIKWALAHAGVAKYGAIPNNSSFLDRRLTAPRHEVESK
mmetsp:Transcript_111093/g.313409  ORF Transcript_111093/g.313409 Transcript_111093/m.313409 type:complete len:217 (+) Transcript_111093:1405-2055(+)